MCEIWQIRANSRDSYIRDLASLFDNTPTVTVSLEIADEDMLCLLHFMKQFTIIPLAELVSVRGLYTSNNPLELVKTAVMRGWILVAPRGNAGVFALADLARNYQLTDPSPGLLLLDHLRGHLPDLREKSPVIPARDGSFEPSREKSPDWTTEAFLEVLRLVDLTQPRVTADKVIHRADLARMQESGRDAGIASESLTLLLHLMQREECLVEHDGRLTVAPKAESWVKQPQAERMRALCQSYLFADDLLDVGVFFPELRDAIVEHMAGSSLRRTYHRRLVVHLLHQLDVGQWYAVQEFVKAIRERDPNVLFLQEPWRAIQAQARGDLAAWREHAWRTHEERLFLWILRVVLTGIGIIEVDQDGAYFRLTPKGVFALQPSDIPCDSYTEDPEPTITEGAVVVQPDFEIIAFLDKCSPELRRKLDAFCDRIRAGHAATYRITDDSIRRGTSAGLSIEEFLRILEQASSRPLPGNVREQFQTWIRKAGVIVIRTNCTLIECLQEKEARRLAKENPRLRLIGTRFLLCQGEIPEKPHYTVSYADSDGAFLEPADDLTLICPWHRTNLFHRKRAAVFGATEFAPNGDLVLHVQITDGKHRVEDWEDTLIRLEQSTIMPLPARYRVAFRTQHEKDVVAYHRTAILLRFDHPEAVDAVLELNGIEKLVEGRLGQYTIAVRKGKLLEVKRLLKRYGIPVVNSKNSWDDRKHPVSNGTPAVKPSMEDINTEQNDTTSTLRTRRRRKARRSEAPTVTDLPLYSPKIVREILEDAMQRRRIVQIAHTSPLSAKTYTRRVKPVTIDTQGKNPTLNAYCCEENVPRQIKLAEIRGIRILEDESF